MKKIILSDHEYAVLQKVLSTIPPSTLPNLNGIELRAYREILTRILHKDYRFPDSD